MDGISPLAKTVGRDDLAGFLASRSVDVTQMLREQFGLDEAAAAQLLRPSMPDVRPGKSGLIRANSMDEVVVPAPVDQYQMGGERFGHNQLDDFLFFAESVGASDLSFTSGEPAWAEIHNWQHRLTSRALTDPEIATLLSNAYNNTNGPGEVKGGKDLDFSYEVRRTIRGQDNDHRIRFRVNATGGRYEKSSGIQLTFRILEGTPRTLGAMNVEPEIIAEIRAERGLVFVTGPTGSGKTTLLGGAVRHLGENPKRSLKMVEYSMPIELVYDDITFPHSHIHQVELERHLRPRDLMEGETIWGYCARNALRRKIGLVILGEARDRSAIGGCLQLAMAGHSVLSTLHTLGVAESFRRVLIAFPASEQQGIAADMLECLNLIVSQLLVRRIGGGRCAVREYGVFSPKVKRILIDTPIENWTSRIREMMADGTMVGQTLSQSADKLYQQGLIDESELKYVTFRERGAIHDTMQDLATTLGIDGEVLPSHEIAGGLPGRRTTTGYES